MDYRGRRATIVGLGHFGGGAAAARWLARQGAVVTVTDLADENTLADALPLLADVPIAAVHLGGHREEDFRDADLIVLNPAVRPDSPWLQVARWLGQSALDGIGIVCRELPCANHRRHRQQRQIDHGRDDRRDPQGGRAADLSRRQHRRQPFGATAADRARRLGRAGNQQFPVVA